MPVCALASVFLSIFGKNGCHTIHIYSQKQRHIIRLAINISNLRENLSQDPSATSFSSR